MELLFSLLSSPPVFWCNRCSSSF